MIRLCDWLRGPAGPSERLPETAGSPAQPASQQEVEEKCKEYFMAGETSGRNAAAVEWAEKMAAESRRTCAEYENQIEALRHEIAASLGEQVRSSIAALQADVEAAVARIMRPFSIRACHDLALQEFREVLRQHLERESSRIRSIAVPHAAFDQIAIVLPAGDGQPAAARSGGLEFHAWSPEGGFETQLATWLDALGAPSDG